MWDLREQISFLLDHGHPDAINYRVGQVWEEAAIVRARLDHVRINDALLMHSTITGVIGGKAGNRVFKDHIDSLLPKE